MIRFHFWSVAALLAGAAVLVNARCDRDIVPPHEPLEEVPGQFGQWNGIDRPIDRDSLRILGDGEFLSRSYSSTASSVPPIDLFIGYFPTQRTGVGIHSPRNCLPSAGWSFESSRYADLRDAAGVTHSVGEHVIEKDGKRQFVVYWYQSHGRSIANDYLARAQMIWDAIKLKRTDAALVRVSTPIEDREGVAAARERAEAFTASMAPLLPRFVPN